MRKKNVSTTVDSHQKKNSILGETLKWIREQIGLSQTEVAELTKKGRQSISKVEEIETYFGLKLMVVLLEQPGAPAADEVLKRLKRMPWPPPKPGPKGKAAKRRERK